MENPNNNPKRPNQPKKRNILVFLPYVLIPLVLIFGVMFATDAANKERAEYYQVVQQFDQGKVDEFSLNKLMNRRRVFYGPAGILPSARPRLPVCFHRGSPDNPLQRAAPAPYGEVCSLPYSSPLLPARLW